VVAAVTARNYASGGDFVPLTSNGGLNFYIGNGPESSGAYEKPKGLDVDEDPSGRGLLGRQVGRALSPSEASAEWRRRATAWIRENPAAELRLLLRKTVFFFSTFEIPQIEAYRFQMRYSPLIRVLQIPFGVVAPLALAATLLARGSSGFILVSFIYTYAASIVLIFVLTRYRLPATPILLLYAVSMTASLVRRVREGNLKDLFRRAAWVVPLAVFCNVNFYHLSSAIGDAQSHYRLGIIAQGAGRTAEAAEEYRRSIELDPAYARSRLNLGELLALSGRTEEAEAELREAVRLDPEYPKALLNLGTLLSRSGRADEGREFLERAVRVDPAYGKAWLNLAAASLASGSPAAEEHAAAALRTLGPADPARPLAEEIRARAGEVATLALWRRANALPPELPQATREAMVAELLGDRPDFLDLYERGVSGADPSALYALGAALYRAGDLARAEAFFARVRAAAPDHPFVSFALGVIAYRGGRGDEAWSLFLAEMSANPGFAPAWKNAAILAAQTGRAEEGRRFAAEYLRRGGEEDDAIRAILGAR
jgi:tetratricopeptide (TPR) repeat protein